MENYKSNRGEKMVKVFHIITGGLRREGIASTQLEFFKNMNLNKIEISVAAVHNNSPEMIADFQENGCKVYELPDRQDDTVRYFFSLVRTMKKIKPDIVHVHGSSAIMSIELLAAKIAGVKVRIAHSRNTKADNAKKDKMLRPLFNQLYTDGMACGEEAGRWLFGDKPFTVVHNGKDFKKFNYDSDTRIEQRNKLHLNGKKVVGHVGRINMQKNHEFLIRAFHEFEKRNPEAVLYLIGGGPLTEERKKQVEELGISDKVIFAGSVNDVPERLQAMDIMVFPSLYEGLPNVVLEWQAEGLPCLISDKITKECAPSDLVKFASIEDDPKIWADKMEQMLEQFTDREEQAKRGTHALKENGFDIVDATRQLENIYLKLAMH